MLMMTKEMKKEQRKQNSRAVGDKSNNKNMKKSDAKKAIGAVD